MSFMHRPDEPHTSTDAGADAGAFRDQFGEELRHALDVGSWRTGGDLAEEYDRLEREVREALHCESGIQREVRRRIFPMLKTRAAAPPGAGVYPARHDVIEAIHRGVLFNGGVEACDGTVAVHDTLPLTIYQVGVSLVSYRGDQGTWHTRLFRRDFRQQLSPAVDAALEVLERRSTRAALNHVTPEDSLGVMARKAMMDYGERALLLHESKAIWRMGHGNPITYELLTGADLLELMVAATTVMRQLIEKHRKFVYVASEPRQRVLLTVGQALRPGEYALVWTLDEQLADWFKQRRFKVGETRMLDWDGEPIEPQEWLPRFLSRVASQVMVGVYRASAEAPAQLFYAHVEHAHYAAHLVLADSLLQRHRGFPLLIDLADHVCTSVFGRSLDHLTETAYARAGVPWRYTSERASRDRG